MKYVCKLCKKKKNGVVFVTGSRRVIRLHVQSVHGVRCDKGSPAFASTEVSYKGQSPVSDAYETYDEEDEGVRR